MTKNDFSKVLKLGALFASVAALAGCGQPVEPLNSESLQRTAEDVKYDRHREYQVLMVRNGCEVGREVFFSHNGPSSSGRPSAEIIALCPPPATADIQPDRISAGLTFNVVHNRFGCEVGRLKEGHMQLAMLTLCPAQGEASAEHAVRTGKTMTSQVVIAQRRPG